MRLKAILWRPSQFHPLQYFLFSVKCFETWLSGSASLLALSVLMCDQKSFPVVYLPVTIIFVSFKVCIGRKYQISNMVKIRRGTNQQDFKIVDVHFVKIYVNRLIFQLKILAVTGFNPCHFTMFKPTSTAYIW